MFRLSLKWIRTTVGCLSGLCLWFVWQSSKTTSPELESIKFRNWLSDAMSIAQPSISDYTNYADWLVFLPLAIICSIMFSTIRPMPRFILWISLSALVTVANFYGLIALHLMLPFGGPLNLLIYCYICGTLIHLETERIERSRAMALALQIQAEEERKRIANDLHDETLPSLSRVMRLADALAEKSDDNAESSMEIRRRLESTIEEMRRVINDLHPAILENLGLAAALSNLAERFYNYSEIKTTFQGQETQVISLPSFSSLCVYRIAQEALNNIEKHSGASLAEVSLSKIDNVMRVAISDNGKGTGSVNARSESFGFQNIMHRASLIGARVEWLKPEHYPSGTMLVLTMPCGPESFSVSSSIEPRLTQRESDNSNRVDRDGKEKT